MDDIQDGNPAVIGKPLRPVALRPFLSKGVPLLNRVQGAARGCSCQRNASHFERPRYVTTRCATAPQNRSSSHPSAKAIGLAITLMGPASANAPARPIDQRNIGFSAAPKTGCAHSTKDEAWRRERRSAHSNERELRRWEAGEEVTGVP